MHELDGNQGIARIQSHPYPRCSQSAIEGHNPKDGWNKHDNGHDVRLDNKTGPTVSKLKLVGHVHQPIQKSAQHQGRQDGRRILGKNGVAGPCKNGRATGREPQIDWQPMQPGDVVRTFANVTRAREELGYDPRVDLDEGLARFVEWYRSARRVAAEP